MVVANIISISASWENGTCRKAAHIFLSASVQVAAKIHILAACFLLKFRYILGKISISSFLL